MNIVTTETGFELNGSIYTWKDDTHTEIICDTQVYAFTTETIILLDLSCTINETKYLDIVTFSNHLN
jgi:hypothetical protein